MTPSEAELAGHLLNRLRDVLQNLGAEATEPLTPKVRFADALDSMGMVEFLGLVAEDCGCDVATVEGCVGHRFTTVQDLACAMDAAELAASRKLERSAPADPAEVANGPPEVGPRAPGSFTRAESSRGQQGTDCSIFLSGIAVRLPGQVQSARELNDAIHRPAGWLERRAGILQRRVWGVEDPLAAAADCAAQSLRDACVPADRLGALLAVSEAPPLYVGLAAAIHHRLGLPAGTPCFELGGACTGFLSAISLARELVPRLGAVLIVSVEAHSRLLALAPGAQGEAAALFGDGAAAAVLATSQSHKPIVRLLDVRTFADGGSAALIQVRQSEGPGFSVNLAGGPLTRSALNALATATGETIRRHGLRPDQLSAIVAHGGNGRMPAMLARQLEVPEEKVWSEVATTGNLGSASVPVAWASRAVAARGPVVWTAVGAGLQWGSALWEVSSGD